MAFCKFNSLLVKSRRTDGKYQGLLRTQSSTPITTSSKTITGRSNPAQGDVPECRGQKRIHHNVSSKKGISPFFPDDSGVTAMSFPFFQLNWPGFKDASISTAEHQGGTFRTPTACLLKMCRRKWKLEEKEGPCTNTLLPPQMSFLNQCFDTLCNRVLSLYYPIQNLSLLCFLCIKVIF